MALDAAPSSPTFNAYCTRAEADAYHAERLHNTAWTGASNADKDAAIVWATRNFETLVWKGWMTNPAQNLQWPRTGVFRNGDEVQDRLAYPLLYSEYMLDGATVPDFLKHATAEAAFWLLSSDTTAPQGVEGFRAIAVDTVKLEMDKRDRLKWLNDATRNLIWRYMKQSNPYVAKTVRV